jgi:hypoxanthine phosphoribosyltransferase
MKPKTSGLKENEQIMKQIDYDKVIDLTEQNNVLPSETTKVLDEKIDTVLIPQKSLKKRVKALARQICDDYRNYDNLYVIVVLKGAFVFASDLVREMYRYSGFGIQLDFIKTSTYGKQIKGTGEFQRGVIFELEPKEVERKDILIVEDLIDQCLTLNEIVKYFHKRNAASVRICILLEKKIIDPSHKVARLKKELRCDYIGFRVPDIWVAGYGIDAGEDFRQLPFLVAVKEDYYR